MDRSVADIQTSILGYLAGTLEFCRDEVRPIDPQLARKIDLLHDEVVAVMEMKRSASRLMR